jgi:hypothetical protein
VENIYKKNYIEKMKSEKTKGTPLWEALIFERRLLIRLK